MRIFRLSRLRKEEGGMSEQKEYGPAEILVDNQAFTESPRWHEGAYWFSDIGSGEVCRVSLDGDREVVLSGMNGPSGLGWTQDGDMLLACLFDSTIWRVGPDRKPRPFVTPANHGTLGTNDMATAGSRSYVTCSGYVLEQGDDGSSIDHSDGCILLVEHDTGECRKVAEKLKMPNGIAISPDGRTLTISELFASCILQYDIQLDGSLANHRIFLEPGYMVDGLCLDAEGGFWFGASECFQRVDAQGSPAGRVLVPDFSCIAPMLCGPDGRTLLLCANHIDEPQDILNGKARARILTVRVDVPAAAQAERAG
jgi:sugar lactone lactonase YvrE